MKINLLIASIFVSGGNGSSPLIEATLLSHYKLEIARKYSWNQSHWISQGSYYVDSFFPWRRGGVYISLRKILKKV